jgi:tetratricopeptide (TPR) repeat protein
MASNIPFVKQIAWMSIIPQLIILFIIIMLFVQLKVPNPPIVGAIVYWTCSIALRYFVPKSHREGMKFTKLQAYEKAIVSFKNSYDFFTKYRWVDNNRYLTLLSSSKMCYREMALCNIAFCYSQIGKGTNAIEYYSLVLEEYPENGLAKSGLAILNSLKDQSQNSSNEELLKTDS